MPDGEYIPTLQFQPYVSPYTAAPVKDVQDFGELLNKRYDENIAQFDKLDELMHQIQVSDADQHLKQGLLDDTRNAVKNIVQNGDWENAKAPVREVARRFANDPIISTAVMNFQKAQKLQDEARQAEMNGKPQINFKDVTNFSTVDPQTGQVRHLDVNGVYEDRLDYQGKMNQMFEGMHPNASGNKTNNMFRDPDTGQLYQVGSGSQWSGITKDDILHTANRQFGNYLASSEGQQRLKVLTTKNSDNAVPMDTATALNVMKQELINAGMNKVFHESSTEQFTKPDRWNKGMAGQQPSGTLINDIAYQGNESLNGLIDAITKKNRDKQIVMNPDGSTSTGYGGSGMSMPQYEYTSGYGKIPKEQQETYNNLATIIKQGLSDKDKNNVDIVNKKVKEYLTNLQNKKIQPSLLAYNDPKDINAANDFFRNGTYQSAEYFDPKTMTKLSWAELYKQLTGNDAEGAKPEDVEKVLKNANITGQYSPDNPFYDMTGKDPNFSMPRKLTIGNSSYVIGSNLQDKSTVDYQAGHLASEISSARRTGIPVSLSHDLKVIPSGNGYLLQQGDSAPRGKKDGSSLSLEEVLALTLGNGITPK